MTGKLFSEGSQGQKVGKDQGGLKKELEQLGLINKRDLDKR